MHACATLIASSVEGLFYRRQSFNALYKNVVARVEIGQVKRPNQKSSNIGLIKFVPEVFIPKAKNKVGTVESGLIIY